MKEALDFLVLSIKTSAIFSLAYKDTRSHHFCSNNKKKSWTNWKSTTLLRSSNELMPQGKLMPPKLVDAENENLTRVKSKSTNLHKNHYWSRETDTINCPIVRDSMCTSLRVKKRNTSSPILEEFLYCFEFYSMSLTRFS